MTAFILAVALILHPPDRAAAALSSPVHAVADSADVWHVYVDGQDVLHSGAAGDSTGGVAELPFSQLNFRTTLTVHYVTEERYPRARVLEFIDEAGQVMFGYEEMEESEDNPMQIPLDALTLALGGAPEGPLSVAYRETSGGRTTRETTVLFVISPD